MKFISAAIVALLALSLPNSTKAESCDTNCHDQCRVKIDFPPANFVEPTCHAKCEVAKKLACTGLDVPTIPITPREQIETLGNAACGSVYYGIVNAVIAECSNWNGRLDGQHLIEGAKNTLVSAGLFNPGEFNGVQIRFCPLRGAQGIAPEAGRIYLNVGMMNSDPTSLASLLGHEMIHVRQHRASHAGSFACNYSRSYVECGGCQDDRHPMEREAYQWERDNQMRIRQTSNVNIGGQGAVAGFCVVGPMQGQFCPLAVSLSVGNQCFCQTPQGVFWGVAR